MKRFFNVCMSFVIFCFICSCYTKKHGKEELLLHFNAYTFETLEGRNKLEGADTPWVKNDATFRLYPDSFIVLQVPVGKGEEVNTLEWKWKEKKEDGTSGTVFMLATPWSGYEMLKLRRDTAGLVIAAAFTKSDNEKIVYFNTH